MNTRTGKKNYQGLHTALPYSAGSHHPWTQTQACELNHRRCKDLDGFGTAACCNLWHSQTFASHSQSLSQEPLKIGWPSWPADPESLHFQIVSKVSLRHQGSSLFYAQKSISTWTMCNFHRFFQSWAIAILGKSAQLSPLALSCGCNKPLAQVLRSSNDRRVQWSKFKWAHLNMSHPLNLGCFLWSADVPPEYRSGLFIRIVFGVFGWKLKALSDHSHRFDLQRLTSAPSSSVCVSQFNEESSMLSHDRQTARSGGSSEVKTMMTASCFWISAPTNHAGTVDPGLPTAKCG